MSERANVLIVDDLERNRIAIEVLLEGMDVQAVSVDSGEAALRFLLNGQAAVILLDIEMPGMSGFETAEFIRKRERTRRVPIVFVTATEASRDQMIRGYRLGAVDFLVKPVIPEVLLAKVGAFVELHRYHLERLESVAEELKQEREVTVALSRQEQLSNAFDGIWEVGLQQALERDYRKVLQAQVGGEANGTSDHSKVQLLAKRIAKAGGGPKELLAVHRKVAETIMARALPKQARPLRDRCRLLTLELMGHLADYYRREASRSGGQHSELHAGHRGAHAAGHPPRYPSGAPFGQPPFQ